MPTPIAAALPGTRTEVVVGPVAHGGHCVARLDGRVVFVRHALPGERVVVELTETGDSAPLWRGDAVKILDVAPDRVPSRWPAAGPGGVGGGELAHVSLDGQRRWKADVIAEQLARLAKIDRAVTVEAAPGDDDRDGLGYRTRITLMAGEDGRAGMRRYRSHDVVALTDMPLATAQVAELAAGEKVFRRRWTPGSRLELIAPANGAAPMLLVDGAPWRGRGPDRRANARRTVTETVTGAAGRGGDQPRAEWTYRLAADGFWQVHREAPGLLVDAVLAGVGDVDGARVLDLYSGAGLFSLPLAQAVGASGRLTTVEGDAVAVKNARRNLHRFGQVDLRHGPVDRVLRDGGAGGERPSADVVVLDPPRVGAGRAVVESIAALRPSRVVYVACDPAAFARDAGYLAGHGYVLEQMRAFDLFPHTHHVEIVAVFTHEKLS